jgi:hypothetical protein
MPNNIKRKLGIAAVLVVIVLVGLFLEFWNPPTDATLTDINSTEELREIFNRDSGSTRVILLVSPT